MSELLLLKKEDCKSCYKCIRECALKSIRFSENRAQIVERECVYCGHCYVTCPQSAKEIRRDTDKAKALIASGRPVIVSLAPSFIADFGVGGLDGMRQALLKLGFADVEETARGARIVKTEYERMIASGERKLIISSCCHSGQSADPEALSPGFALSGKGGFSHARPCQEHQGAAYRAAPWCSSAPASPRRTRRSSTVRWTVCSPLTSSSHWLAEEGIELPAGEQPDGTEARSRFFPTSGRHYHGRWIWTMGYSYIAIDGLHRLHGRSGGDRAGRHAELLCGDECLRGQLHRRPGHAPVPQRAHHAARPGWNSTAARAAGTLTDQPADDLRKSMQLHRLGRGEARRGRHPGSAAASWASTVPRTSSTAAPADTAPAGKRPLRSARARPT